MKISTRLQEHQHIRSQLKPSDMAHNQYKWMIKNIYSIEYLKNYFQTFTNANNSNFNDGLIEKAIIWEYKYKREALPSVSIKTLIGFYKQIILSEEISVESNNSQEMMIYMIVLDKAREYIEFANFCNSYTNAQWNTIISELQTIVTKFENTDTFEKLLRKKLEM